MLLTHALALSADHFFFFCKKKVPTSMCTRWELNSRNGRRRIDIKYNIYTARIIRSIRGLHYCGRPPPGRPAVGIYTYQVRILLLLAYAAGSLNVVLVWYMCKSYIQEQQQYFVQGIISQQLYGSTAVLGDDKCSCCRCSHMNSSLQCSAWSQDRLQSLLYGYDLGQPK